MGRSRTELSIRTLPARLPAAASLLRKKFRKNIELTITAVLVFSTNVYKTSPNKPGLLLFASSNQIQIEQHFITALIQTLPFSAQQLREGDPWAGAPARRRPLQRDPMPCRPR